MAKNFIKISVVIGVTGLTIYGAVNLYRLYKSMDTPDLSNGVAEYQSKYINSFIRKNSQTSK